MEKFDRIPLNKLQSLIQYETKLQQYCEECKNGTREWSSSGKLYLALRNELKNFTKGHCSFCDGYPLKVTSKKTIEHYFPKNDFPEKTFQWENLYYCCDQCQTNAKSKSFIETLKPDYPKYEFENIFYFDPQTGQVKVIENLETKDNDLYLKAHDFLKRYGINENEERLYVRKTTYGDSINLLLNDSLGPIDLRPYRFVVRTARKVLAYNRLRSL